VRFSPLQDKRKRGEDDFEKQLEELRSQLLAMDKRTDIVPMSQLEKEFEEKKRKLEEDIREFKKNLESKDNKIEKLEQSVEDTKLELQTKAQQLQSAQKKEEAFESEKSDLAKQIDTLKKQVESTSDAQMQKETLEEELNKIKGIVPFNVMSNLHYRRGR
jgi:chromosome segregation ATPase